MAFPTTCWSRVVRAGDQHPGGRAVLADLCRDYWYPLYAHLRARRMSSHDAEDAVQSFMANLLETGALSYADQHRGRFRSFLLHALHRYLNRQRESNNSVRRRPPGALISFDASDAEQRWSSEAAPGLTPAETYERVWAMSVLRMAMDQLKADFDQRGKLDRFEYLHDFLLGDEQGSLRDTAEALGMTAGALRVELHRMRRSFARLVTQQIARTVEDEADVADEMRFLLEAVSR